MKNLLTKTHVTFFAALILLLGLGLNILGFIDYDAAHAIADPALVILFVSLFLFSSRMMSFTHGFVFLLGGSLSDISPHLFSSLQREQFSE